MTENAAVTIAAIVAIVVLIALYVFRDRLAALRIAVFGHRVDVEGAHPGASVKDARAGRDVKVTDETGRGAQATSVDAGRDIGVHSSPPPKA
jgi:hypothetical protein